MKNKVLVFAGSNSKNSINKQFAIYAANQLQNIDVQLVDLNDYESPLYSVDLEKEGGVHEKALQFYHLIIASDAIVASFPEYNGLHTSAFKNLWDWMSRIQMEKRMNIFDGKPMFLLSTSPSAREMNNVMQVSKQMFPHFGANIVASFYLPSFNHFFDGNEITDSKNKEAFKTEKEKFQTYLNNQ